MGWLANLFSLFINKTPLICLPDYQLMIRELLVSVRYNEPGSQWSGSFIPDQLGDTQVKMRNYITGSSNILRIEVQNVDVPIDNKIVGNGRGNSGTNLILLSDDDTGYIPYRIDNFSKEVSIIVPSSVRKNLILGFNCYIFSICNIF